jgi:predicted transcriptional regulator
MEVPLTKEQEKLLEELASRSQKPKATVAVEAIEAYLDHERWFRQQVKQGQASALRGELLEHDEVVRQIEQKLHGK